MRLLFLLIASSLIQNSIVGRAFAEATQKTQAHESRMHHNSQRSFEEWTPYVGANLGYAAHNSDIEAEGFPTSIKLIGSFVPNSMAWVYDFGFGLQGQRFTQDSAQDRMITTSLLELGARYQFENRWQYGAVYNRFFNKGQNYGANQADADFLGFQMFNQFTYEDDYLVRLGGRLMTSLNAKNESVNMALIDVELGWQ